MFLCYTDRLCCLIQKAVSELLQIWPHQITDTKRDVRALGGKRNYSSGRAAYRTLHVSSVPCTAVAMRSESCAFVNCCNIQLRWKNWNNKVLVQWRNAPGTAWCRSVAPTGLHRHSMRRESPDKIADCVDQIINIPLSRHIAAFWVVAPCSLVRRYRLYSASFYIAFWFESQRLSRTRHQEKWR